MSTTIEGKFVCATCKVTWSRGHGYQLKAGQPAELCEPCYDRSRGLVLWREDGAADTEQVFDALLAWHAERGLPGPAEDQYAGLRVLSRVGESLHADPFRESPAETVRATLPNGNCYVLEADWSGSDCYRSDLQLVVLSGEVVQ